jgi:hypothetical protein
MNHYNYVMVNKRDQLISAPMSFSNYTTVSLSFDHAYAQRATIKDSLIVSISADCGTSWTRVLAAGPNSSQPNVYATHAPMMEAFYPASTEDWCGSSYGTSCYSVDLSPWAGLSNIKLMFETFNRNGNNLFIDNVEVSGPVKVKEHPGSLGLSLYPNPSEGIFTLEVSDGTEKIDIAVCDLQGKEVYKGQLPASTGKRSMKLNLEGLTKGIYYVRLTATS